MAEKCLFYITVPQLQALSEQRKRTHGGGYRARENYIGMHRVQAKKLQHDKRKEESSRQNGNQEVL